VTIAAGEAERASRANRLTNEATRAEGICLETSERNQL